MYLRWALKAHLTWLTVTVSEGWLPAESTYALRHPGLGALRPSDPMIIRRGFRGVMSWFTWHGEHFIAGIWIGEVVYAPWLIKMNYHVGIFSVRPASEQFNPANYSSVSQRSCTVPLYGFLLNLSTRLTVALSADILTLLGKIIQTPGGQNQNDHLALWRLPPWAEIDCMHHFCPRGK